MMSNISDERLIVAAVKYGDSEAMKELKDRAIFGQYGIRNALKKMGCSEADIKVLQPHLLEFVFRDFHRYGFTGSYMQDGWRLAVVITPQYKKNNKAHLFDNPKKEKALQTEPSKLNDLHKNLKHPPLEEIDLEIRTLVSLLNQSPNIRTVGPSCSGHPTQRWDPYGGYLKVASFGNSTPRKTLDFLVGVLIQLDNTSTLTNNVYLPGTMQIERSIRNDNTTFAEAIHERYKQVDAEDLYCSGTPIVLMRVYFRLYVCHPNEKHSIDIWKHLIACIKELIPEDEELTTEVDTPETAMQLLQKALHRLPFLFSTTLTTSQEGYPGIVLNTIADLPLLQWFSTLADKMHEHFDNAGYVSSPDADGDIPFVEKWSFTLRPFLNQECIPLPHLLTPQWEPRTREDHLKIWKLLELAVTEQLESEGITVKTDNI